MGEGTIEDIRAATARLMFVEGDEPEADASGPEADTQDDAGHVEQPDEDVQDEEPQPEFEAGDAGNASSNEDRYAYYGPDYSSAEGKDEPSAQGAMARIGKPRPARIVAGR